jgi:hypothetical protein
VAGIYRHWFIDLTAVDDPSELRYGCTFQLDSREITEGMAPTVYVFSKNEIPYIAPEVTTIWASFDPDPEWLDDARWYGRSSEVKDGFRLTSYEE